MTPPQLTVLLLSAGYKSRWAWSRVLSREFGEVFLIVESFLHHAHSFLLFVLGRRKVSESRGLRRQPARQVVGRGGLGGMAGRNWTSDGRGKTG